MAEAFPGGRWGLPLLFAGFVAGLTAAGWFALNHLGVRLREFGWPFSSVISLAILNGVGGFFLGRAYQLKQIRHAADQEDPVEDEDDEEPTDDHLPALPTFAQRTSVERRNPVRVGEGLVDVFDLSTEESDGDGGTVRVTRTIALLPAEGLPHFELRPVRLQDHILAWAGAVGLEFDERAPGTLDGADSVAKFTAAYRLTVVNSEAMIAGTVDADEEAVRRLFPLQVMQKVLSRPDWHLQSHGGYLICWVASDPLGSKRREQLAADSVDLLAGFRAAQAGRAGEPVAAPPGAASAPRQAARLQASLLGGVLGAFAGFFAAALLQVGGLIGPNNMSAAFPVSIVAGVLLGATTGRLIPLRKPLLQKPKDSRREKVVGCAVLIGVFGGFFAGGITGFLIGQLLELKIDDHKTRALLFFGGMGAGALLTPIVLGIATNSVYQGLQRLRGRSSADHSRP